MHMIFPSMPITASTELTEFLYISCRKKIPHPFWRPSAGARGHMPPPSTRDHSTACYEIITISFVFVDQQVNIRYPVTSTCHKRMND